jgi:hypothetical protein
MIGKKVSDIMMPRATDSKQKRELGESTSCCSADRLILDSETIALGDLSVDLLDHSADFGRRKLPIAVFSAAISVPNRENASLD